jgi:hypothetical protein
MGDSRIDRYECDKIISPDAIADVNGRNLSPSEDASTQTDEDLDCGAFPPLFSCGVSRLDPLFRVPYEMKKRKPKRRKSAAVRRSPNKRRLY